MRNCSSSCWKDKYEINYIQSFASAEKFSRGGGGANEKTSKNTKRYRKIALLSLFQEGATGKKTTN